MSFGAVQEKHYAEGCEGGGSDVLRSIVKVTLKSVTKGGKEGKNCSKKRYDLNKTISDKLHL